MGKREPPIALPVVNGAFTYVQGAGCSRCFPLLLRQLRNFRVAAIGSLRFRRNCVGHDGQQVANQFDLGGELHGGLGAHVLKRRTPVAFTFSALKADKIGEVLALPGHGDRLPANRPLSVPSSSTLAFGEIGDAQEGTTR